MKRLVVSMLVLLAVAIGIVQLAKLTMTTHEPVDPDSRLTVVVEADTNRYSPGAVQRLTRSLFLTCRIEANMSPVERDFQALGDESFRFVISPALDKADQRQLHGCLQDTRVDQLLVKVTEMRVSSPNPSDRP